MKILLLGDASFVHTILRKGLKELGHEVTLMSAESKHLDCERDVSLQRDMRLGVLGGVIILLKLLANIPRMTGNDIVQVHDYRFIPFKAWLNKVVFRLLRLTNRRVVKCCLNDDYVILDGQEKGILRYSDTYIGRRPINEKENEGRVREHHLPSLLDCCRYTNAGADALLPCLYEYYRYYDLPEYRGKLHYMPLPIDIPEGLRDDKLETGTPVKVLVGIQKERDYIKGAALIAGLVDRIAAENPGRIEVKRVCDVPYRQYLKMIDEADVLVDQLYSYTPSMNSLAAMAHGTAVIGGGEEEFYEFIGEKTLRPIINVRPEADEANLGILRRTLLNPGILRDLKRQSLEFVVRHHDYLKVSGMYADVYKSLLGDKPSAQ